LRDSYSNYENTSDLHDFELIILKQKKMGKYLLMYSNANKNNNLYFDDMIARNIQTV